MSSSAPIVANETPSEGIAGKAYTYQIAATNSPASYSVKGKLPKGLKVDQVTGLISGTLSEDSASSYAVTLKAYKGKAAGMADDTFTVK